MYNYSFSFIFSTIKRLTNEVIICNTKAGKFNIVSCAIIICNTKTGKFNVISCIIIIYNIKASKSNVTNYILISVALFKN